jgi:acetoin utilization deacetylase AcuC-like enzyme
VRSCAIIPPVAGSSFDAFRRAPRAAVANAVDARLTAANHASMYRQKPYSRRTRGAILPPDLLIVSAGFDAHRRDPLGNLNLVEADYAWATRKLMEIARKRGRKRVVSVLEGGYDLEGLSRSVAAHVTALMEG